MRQDPVVSLVSMPWAPLLEPSLGLGILSARLDESGIKNTVHHQNIFLLQQLKYTTYQALAGQWALNDFLFSENLDSPDLSPVQEALIRAWADTNADRDLGDFTPPREHRLFREYLLTIRHTLVPQFLADCLRTVLEDEPTVVGFTCMFDQTIASVSLAREIRSAAPDTLIVMGGYALQPPVGPQLLRCFPFVDAILFGEGEDTIVSLAEASLDRSRLAAIPGLTYRDKGGDLHESAPVARPLDLNDSPAPNYDHFFADLARLWRDHQVRITTQVLPVESSRGCWWGEVSHCIFCGIDDETMRYRHKDSQAVIGMLDQLHHKHGIDRFRFSDYILPHAYYRTLLPNLAERGGKYALHWEMKSNVNLEQVQLMHAAGVRDLQPGIESFSTSVLKRIRKGVTGIQNVLTIKLLMEQHIGVHYNILYEFPGDEPAEYWELCERIPLLYHLMPPHTNEGIITSRYSPIQQSPEQYGGSPPLRAAAYYHLVFSEEFLQKTGFKLEDYCYIFERPYPLDSECQMLYGIMVFQIIHWCTVFQQRIVELSWQDNGNGITFRDSRYSESPEVKVFPADALQVYRSISQRILSPREISEELGQQISVEGVGRILEELEGHRLIFREGDKCLGLALSSDYYAWREAQRLASAAVTEGVSPQAAPAAAKPLRGRLDHAAP